MRDPLRQNATNMPHQPDARLGLMDAIIARLEAMVNWAAQKWLVRQNNNQSALTTLKTDLSLQNFESK